MYTYLHPRPSSQYKGDVFAQRDRGQGVRNKDRREIEEEGKEEVRIDGEDFRHLFGLNSASVEIERKETDILFHVEGVGHGFGMSQYGANCKALNGEKYDEILKAFFYGTELAKFE